MKFNSITRIFHVPIIGTIGVGKTAFNISLGYLISQKHWGAPNVDSLPYYREVLPFVMKGQELPPTTRSELLTIEVEYIKEGSRTIPANLKLTTGDISGQQFEDATRLLARRPISDDTSELPPSIEALLQVLKRADGLIVIIDITRYISDSSLLSNAILEAFADQIQVICTGIDLILAMSGSKIVKNVFFVFNKQDLHGCTAEQIDPIFRSAWAMELRRLRKRGIIVKVYACSSVGWDAPSQPERVKRLAGYGIEPILIDMVKILKPLKIDSQSSEKLALKPLIGKEHLTRPLFFRGKYYRKIAEAIIEQRSKWIAENGPFLLQSEIWIYLRRCFPNADIHPEDISKAIDVVNKREKESKVTIRGPLIQLKPISLTQDEFKLIEVASRHDWVIALEDLTELAKEGWTRERMEAVLDSLGQVGRCFLRDGKWFFRPRAS